MQIIEKITQNEQAVIDNFFNSFNIKVPPLPSWVDDEIIQYWDDLIFHIHYIPKIALEKNLLLPLWKDKPSWYFYKKIEQGKFNKKAKELSGKWILIDARDKPCQKSIWLKSTDPLIWLFAKFDLDLKNYLKKNQAQLHKQEYMNEILSQKGYGSRFCLSIYDIEKLKPDILKILRIENKKVRLPYFIEYNYLGNVFYKQWATTETWEWLEDKTSDNQNLAGGSLAVGCVSSDPPDYWSTILTFRPIIEL